MYGVHTYFHWWEKTLKRYRMEAGHVQLSGCTTEFELCPLASVGNHLISHQGK